MRALRRQLTTWKRDFLGYWIRLRTFHRIAIGLILAIVAFWAAREYLFDPLRAEIGKQHEALKEAEAPEVVPLIDDDTDVQESRMKIENLKRTLADRRVEMEEAVGSRPKVTQAQKGEVITEFESLITQSGLMLLRRGVPAPAGEEEGKRGRKGKGGKGKEEEGKGKGKKEEKEALDAALHDYVLSGSFDAVHDFVRKVDTFRYPARLCNVWVGSPDDEGEPRSAFPGGAWERDRKPRSQALPGNALDGRFEIILKFRLKLYLHD